MRLNMFKTRLNMFKYNLHRFLFDKYMITLKSEILGNYSIKI